jgi:translation initiation factor 1
MAKKKNKRIGTVYSTNPDFDYNYESEPEAELLPPQQQKLRVSIDRKQRKGKEVTLITGFAGPEDTLKELAKFLKTKCGVGGSAKDGEVIIQGNHRDRVVDLLKEEGYTQTKASGG